MPRGNAQLNATRHAQAVKLRQKCLDLRVAGMSCQQIADQLGIARITAARHVAKALDDLSKQTQDNAERLRRLELERLDKLQRAAERVLARNHVYVSSGKVVVDDGAKLTDDGPVLQAIDRLLRIGERRAKLLGLDAPTKITDGEGNAPIKVVIGVDPDAA